MTNYNRFPGPWKRCADAAGGNADAGGMLSHIHLRVKTNDALINLGGKKYIAQSVRCWQQEIPLSKRRILAAIERLQKSELVEVVVRPISSPSKITHICLTEKAAQLLNARKHLARRVPNDMPDSDQSINSLADDNKLTTDDLKESSEPTLLRGERDEPSGDKKKKDNIRRGKRHSSSKAERVSPFAALHDIWARIEKEKTPDLPTAPITPYERSLLPGASRALGEDAELVIRAVLDDWDLFRYFLEHLGRKKVATERNFCTLLLTAGQARRWALQRAKQAMQEQECYLSPKAQKLLGIGK